MGGEVGTADGSGDGRSDGVAVGTAVGAEVGSLVGTLDGAVLTDGRDGGLGDGSDEGRVSSYVGYGDTVGTGLGKPADIGECE